MCELARLLLLKHEYNPSSPSSPSNPSSPNNPNNPSSPSNPDIDLAVALLRQVTI